MDLKLAGKVVLITGSSRGIGLASAKAFAAEGCRIMLSARSAEQLREAETALRATGAAVEKIKIFGLLGASHDTVRKAFGVKRRPGADARAARVLATAARVARADARHPRGPRAGLSFVSRWPG